MNTLMHLTQNKIKNKSIGKKYIPPFRIIRNTLMQSIILLHFPFSYYCIHFSFHLIKFTFSLNFGVKCDLFYKIH